MAESPAPTQGIVLTHFIVASDVDRTRRFYADVLGGEILREAEPPVVALANSWIIINTGGPPTDYKPMVTLKTPRDPDYVSSFLNIRVADSLGMARGVLSSRLRKLTDQGILTRRQYSEHPPRYEYALTEKGRALAPVITALMTWGDTWAPGPSGPPVVLIHEPCGHAMHPVQTCPHCHDEVTTGSIRSVPGPGAGSNGPANANPDL